MIDPAANGDFDLDACLRAPVHLSGAIQPHGYLVSCSLADWRIRHVSANVETLLGMPPGELVGQPVNEFIEEDVLSQVSDAIAALATGDATAQRVCTANVGALMTICDVTVHAVDGLLHIELEPQPTRGDTRAPTAIAQRMIARLGQDDVGHDFFRQVAAQVAGLTGYDRVMVYRFREDDSGEVIAEVAADGMEPYLGLRYPATDIPPPARALYLRNRIRIIPDASYEAVPVVPGADASGAPLDLSQHVLRSVAPVHLEYLRNMGVAASMSISIISGGRLWGLIACHHRVPRRVSASARAAADLFGMFVSMRVAAREQERTMERFDRAQRLREAMVVRLAQARDFDQALADELELVREVLECDGAGLAVAGRWHASGRAPASRDPAPLLAWAAGHGPDEVVMTDRADDWNTPALAAPGLAGLLAINLGAPGEWLFLFRVEQVEEVSWAGQPHKALVATDDGQRLAPRKSFATWRETVSGRGRPWSGSDRRGAERLHRVLREQRGRSRARDPRDVDGRYQRQALHDQKLRLDNVAMLLEGLVHLDAAETAGISARIDRLEADLHRLMHQTRPARLLAADGDERERVLS
ncbi:MAG: GAF domain-containing protein [Lysobacter sp.]|nr:GAF domain-containing protein [Lysobacter sp.]MDV5981685.1 GAF domain-containing protein [Lysobacter sp.]